VKENKGPLDHNSSPLGGTPESVFFEHSGAVNMLVASDMILLAVKGCFQEMTGYALPLRLRNGDRAG